MAGYNSACLTVGGDYYDFIPYGDEGLGFVLGDVAGKGMPAALLMTGLQARVRMLSERRGDLAKMMSELDRNIASGCPGNRFVSMVWCFLDAPSGELEYCNAGHNPPVIVRNDDKIELLPGGGTMLGIFPALGYEAGKTVLAPGDMLVIYSDGVTEAMNAAGEEFGEERFVDLLRSMGDEPAAAVIERTNAALASWMADEPQSDDITLLAVRRT